MAKGRAPMSISGFFSKRFLHRKPVSLSTKEIKEGSQSCLLRLFFGDTLSADSGKKIVVELLYRHREQIKKLDIRINALEEKNNFYDTKTSKALLLSRQASTVVDNLKNLMVQYKYEMQDQRLLLTNNGVDELKERLLPLEEYHENNKCSDCKKIFNSFLPQTWRTLGNGKYERCHEECYKSPKF